MKFVIVDLETTGNQPADEIIQIGLVLIEDGKITERYSSFVKPRNLEIPPFIQQLTGITEEHLKEAPPLDEVIAEVLPFLRDAVFVAHHAAFDLGFLQRALDACGYSPFQGRVLDTIDMLRMVMPGLSSLSLSMVSAELELEHERPHHADSDAEATAMIWLQCLERLEQLPLITIQRLAHLFSGDHAGVQDLSWFFEQLRVQKELSTVIDTEEQRYFRQFALRVGDWRDDGDDSGDVERRGEFLEPTFSQFYADLKQRLQEHVANYESREAQELMVEGIFDVFEEDRHFMVEAGTGTGKSLGYLIPSLYYGLKHEEKVVVSTHTINLQEQLRQRDIPLLQHVFPVPFRAAVMKGRNHYLCLRKFEHKINALDFERSRDDLLTAAQMVIWLSETEHGEDEELNFGVKGADFWHSVSSDAESCLNRECPWFRKCFYHRAKYKASEADLVITNHSLMLTDIVAENRLLPSYDRLVIDEAHHLEEVASRHLGTTVSYFTWTNLLQLLYRDARNGQLPALISRLEQSDSETLRDAAAQVSKLLPLVVEVKQQWDELTQWLYDQYMKRMETGLTEGAQLTFRIKADPLPREWETGVTMEDNLHVLSKQLLKPLESLVGELKELDDADELQGELTDVSGVVKELLQVQNDIRNFIQMKHKDYVYWMEASVHFKSKSLHLICVPIDVSGMLRQLLFDKKESVVLTSATLSVGRTFDYYAGQLGLDASKENGKLKTLQLPSPFDYRNNVLLLIPRDFPRLKGGDTDGTFVRHLVRSLKQIAVAMKGRMLVLFTSYKMLREVHGELKEDLSSEGITVLGQGIDSNNRSKLTRWFQDNKASVLLGTSSFWEGVDIPGEALSCLAIVRLPFQPPNHPIVEAKSEYLKKQNKNPFMDYAVPQAVIRFKQGFGRLVRKTDDHGIVIVYDTRVIDTQYGKHFLYSLPGPKMEHMSQEMMVTRIQEWLEAREMNIENAENF